MNEKRMRGRKVQFRHFAALHDALLTRMAPGGTQPGAPLPPLAPESSVASGSLRLQLFVSLPSRVAADLGPSPLRVRITFGGDAGGDAGGTWAVVDQVTGAVVAFPVLGPARAFHGFLAAAGHASLTLYGAGSSTPLGRVLVDCTAAAQAAQGGDPLAVLPPPAGWASPSLAGASVDASWRLSVWDTADEEEEDDDVSSVSGGIELLSVGAPPLRPRPAKVATSSSTWRMPWRGMAAMELVRSVATPFRWLLDGLDAVVTSTSAPETRDLHRVAATLCFATSCVVNPFLGQQTALGLPADGLVLLHPSPMGFSVAWPLCASLLFLYVLFQALPAKRATPLLRRCGWRTAAALAVLSLWSALATVAAGQRGAPPTFAAKLFRAAVAASLAAGVLTTAFCLVHACIATVGHPVAFTEAEHLCVLAPLGLTAGWIATLAPSNSLSAAVDALAVLGMEPPPLRGSPAAVALLLSGLGTCLATWQLHGHPYFALAAVWGFATISQQNTRAGLAAAAAAQGVRDNSHTGDLGAVCAALISAGCVASTSLARIWAGGARRWSVRRGSGGWLSRLWDECAGAILAGRAVLEDEL